MPSRAYPLLFYALVAAGTPALVRPALAFPPYKSTDADTAEPKTIEARLGVQFEVEHGLGEILAPRIRLNFGLPNKVEISSEFDFASRRGTPDDGALGLKWIPITSESVNIGVEALALLPVRKDHQGFGTETQFLATFRAKQFLLHLNAGGFYDPRGTIPMSGWRGSALLEVPIDKLRVGFELFAKGPRTQLVDARAGLGLIYDAGTFDVRAGLHAGVSPGAPKLTINLWIGKAFPLL